MANKLKNNNILEEKLISNEEKIISNHPVELIQKTYYKNQETLKNFTISNIFGHHMFIRRQMEQTILSQFQRLPTLYSEFCGLETILGEDETIDTDDYLNDPQDSYEIPPSIHEIMEKKLHLGIDSLHLSV